MLNKIVYYVTIAALLFYVVSTLGYRFRHPEKTETQILINIKDVVLWR